MSYRIPLSVILLAILAITLVTAAWLALNGGDAVLSDLAAKAPQRADWGWQ